MLVDCNYHTIEVLYLLIVPTPPNDVHALHVGIGTNSAYLVMVWTQMVKEDLLIMIHHI